MRLYSLSEVAERVGILREIYDCAFSDALAADQELESAMRRQKKLLKKMKKCDAALDILEKLAYEDLMESFKNIRDRIPNELPF